MGYNLYAIHWYQDKIMDLFGQARKQYYTSLVLCARLAKISHLTPYSVKYNKHANMNGMYTYNSLSTFLHYYILSPLSRPSTLYVLAFSFYFLSPPSLYTSLLTFSLNFVTPPSYCNFLFHFLTRLSLSKSSSSLHSTFSFYFRTPFYIYISHPPYLIKFLLISIYVKA